MKQERFEQPIEPGVDVTQTLIRRASLLASAPLDADICELAKQCVLDWIGVSLVGAREPAAQILLAQIVEDCDSLESGPASIIGSGRKFSVRQAAFVNGTAGHAIDYDDLNIAAQGHVTTAVLPAALAVAEVRHATGDALLRAFAAGYEAACIVGRYLGRGHYDRGFHGTSTVGSFGAACAAGLLMHLDERTLAVALGIAGTQAGGMKAQFGTMCKPFHAGKANENGVLAAQLARRGFTGRTDFLEAPQGFAVATSPVADIASAFAAAPGGSFLWENLFKYHAACYGTHAALEAILKLCRDHEIGPDDIRSVTLEVEAGADRMCNIPEPKTALETKFSLRFNAALAITGENTASPDTYSERNAKRPDLCDLRDLVSVRLMPAAWPLMQSAARIETKRGLDVRTLYDSSVPDPDLHHQRERLSRKFMALAVPILGESKAVSIVGAIDSLEHLDDIGALMSMIR